MWLLMCDLNVLQAFEVESSESPGFSLSEASESLAAESNPPNSGDADSNQKPQQTSAQSDQSEPLKFGNFLTIDATHILYLVPSQILFFRWLLSC
ncbi:hypothetical protein Bca52824_062004 [Brassica carinata]|uniref:Uncharacterized protein n=1 Tax=Brassica carinata TaxID=52824 RepID=A0A8X7U6V4_BRACI|nr:hypothetical protein Bca52824_062004 [Brassica carinata]